MGTPHAGERRRATNHLRMAKAQHVPHSARLQLPARQCAGQLPGVIFKDQVEELVLSAFGEGLFAGFDLTSSVFNFLLPRGIVLNSTMSIKFCVYPLKIPHRDAHFMRASRLN